MSLLQICRNPFYPYKYQHTRPKYQYRSCIVLCEGVNRVLFLGSPDVAAVSLKALLDKQQEKNFEIVGVVSQPARNRSRGKTSKKIPTPVYQLAEESNIANIWTPISAEDEQFLQDVQSLKPDLCITAAYGNVLPQQFLDIPRFGTLNIHPSLLPKYRGASPVPRSIQAGDDVTGVSVAFTVLKMDAGPVLAQTEFQIDQNATKVQVLQDLFQLGTSLLLENMDLVFAGQGMEKAVPQDEQSVTKAKKLSTKETWLDFSKSARELHNQVRAFFGWPGTRVRFRISSEAGTTEQEVKIIETKLVNQDIPTSDGNKVVLHDGSMYVQCGDEMWIEILIIQPVGKRKMNIKDYQNGLPSQQIQLLSS